MDIHKHNTQEYSRLPRRGGGGGGGEGGKGTEEGKKNVGKGDSEGKKGHRTVKEKNWIYKEGE
jgi:hypothetical protein